MGWSQGQGWLSSCHEAEQQLGQDKALSLGMSLLLLQLLLLQPRDRKGPDPAYPEAFTAALPVRLLL